MEELSKIYDSILYGVMCFDEEQFIEEAMEFTDDMRDALANLHAIQKNKKFKLDKNLMSFFYRRNSKGSFLAKYLVEGISIENITNYNLESFIDHILDKKAFYHHFLAYFLMDDDDNLEKRYSNVNTVRKRINGLIYTEELVLNFLAVYYNFDEWSNRLVEELRTIYNLVQNLYSKNENIIKDQISTCNQRDNIRALSMASKVPESLYPERPVIFSLINTYLYKSYADMEILGLNFLPVLEEYNEYGHITLKSFGEILSNQYMNKIYDVLCGGNALNINELSERLNMPIPVFSKYLQTMLFENAVIVSRVVKTGVYYKLNDEYVIRACNIISRNLRESERNEKKKKKKNRSSRKDVVKKDDTTPIFE
jgi:DNA-binding transcriptional ArsR family regulator